MAAEDMAVQDRAAQEQQRSSTAPRRARFERSGMSVMFPDIGLQAGFGGAQSIARVRVVQSPSLARPINLV
jgi:hypothetical protein